MAPYRRLRKPPLANYLRGYWHLLRPPAWPLDSLPLLKRISAYGIEKPKRVLHVGANNGAEAKYYSENGIEAWHIEAIPGVFDALCANCKAHTEQHALLACLSSRSGEHVNFNISSNLGLSSSLLGLGRHHKAYPSVRYIEQITLTTTTIDELIAQKRIPIDIAFLVIDAQGAEALILEGAQTLLAFGTLRGAMIETAVEPLYEGGSTYMDTSMLLRAHHLYLYHASFNREGWCDAIYAQKYWP